MKGDPKIASQAHMFGNRLRKNARKLKGWVGQQGISCYRVYDRDIPELPFAVDVYEGSLHMAEYARRSTAELSVEKYEAWLAAVVEEAASALEIEPRSVFLKRRERQRGRRQYKRVAHQGAHKVVTEGGLRFVVNLSDYLDTGLFLDHRPTRAMVRKVARGSRFLNLFGYTGAFTVYAADGGASSTTTVDLSNTYLDWARENLEINGFMSGSGEHAFIRSDVSSFLESQAHQRARFDLVVVDPPTFSNSKSMSTSFDVQRDHGPLLRKVITVLAPGGEVFFSTNFKRFRLDVGALSMALIEDITEATIPRDFRDRRVHSCFRLRRARRRLI